MSGNIPVVTSLDALAVGRTSSTSFITHFDVRDPNSNDVNYLIQQRWYNKAKENEWILTGFNIINEVKTAVWQPISAFTTVTETLTGNSGGAVGVDGSNNINTIGAGSITVVGNPSSNTLTTELTGLTNHAVLLGAGTSTITSLAGGATGTVLAGNTGADPSFQTLSSLPVFTSINIQVFTLSGTYTPTANMQYCIIECVGGGGGGGGSANSSSSVIAIAGGGGAGSYSKKFASATTIGSSQTVTVGTAGSGGASGNNAGSAGTGSSVGSLCTTNGGAGGSGNNGSSGVGGGAGGAAGTGTFAIAGGSGYVGPTGPTSASVVGGGGGISFYSAGASDVYGSSGSSGANAPGYGGGGGGAYAYNATGAQAGGNGSAGVVIITEYI